MKGIWHVAIGVALGSVAVIALDVFSLALLLPAICYLTGLLLPDADMKSLIWFTPLLPFALLAWLAELPLSVVLGRQKGHRQSLHTIVGVLVTSALVGVVVSNAGSVLGISTSVVWCMVATLLGQLIHLLLDGHWALT